MIGCTSWNHFVLLMIVGRYSLTHRRQKLSSVCFTMFQLFFSAIPASVGIFSGSRTPLELSNKKWLGVSDSWSAVSSGMNVNGLEFTILSASANTVVNDSSSSFLTTGTDPRADLTARTILSQQPPMCGAAGGLNFHWVLAFVKVLPNSV